MTLSGVSLILILDVLLIRTVHCALSERHLWNLQSWPAKRNDLPSSRVHKRSTVALRGARRIVSPNFEWRRFSGSKPAIWPAHQRHPFLSFLRNLAEKRETAVSHKWQRSFLGVVTFCSHSTLHTTIHLSQGGFTLPLASNLMTFPTCRTGSQIYRQVGMVIALHD